MSLENFQPKIQEVLLKSKGPKEKGVFCETFVYQPENIEEMKLGCLFILGRLEDSPESSHIINLLTSIIKREYYINPKRNPLKSLEGSFKKANTALADLTKNNDFSWLAKMDFICAVVAKNYLHLTKIGRSKMFLLREGNLTDIGKKLVPSQEKVLPQKAFQSIASGKIFLHDKIILATGDIFRHIPSKGLKQIIELGEIGQLEKIIQDSKNFPTQGMILIEAVREKEMPVKMFETITLEDNKEAADETNENLPSVKRTQSLFLYPPSKIENILSEIALVWRNFIFKTKDRWRLSKSDESTSLWNTLNRKSQAIAETLRLSAEKQKHAKDKNEPIVNRNSASQKKWELISKQNIKAVKGGNLNSLLLRLKKIISFLFMSLEKTFSFLTAIFKITADDFSKMSRQAKKIFFVFLAIAVLSAFSARYFYNQKYQKQIILNEQNAKESQEKVEQINKIYRIESSAQRIDLSQNKYNFIPQQIIAIKDSLLATGSASESLYSLPYAAGQNGNFIADSLPKNQVWKNIALIKGNSIILLSPDSQFYKYDFANKSVSQLPIRLPAEAEITDLAIYKNNLYILDSKNSQIIKCPDLNNCQTWTKEKENVSQAVSMAIDGTVYLLQNNGFIIEYFNGFKKNTIQPKIKPPLSKEITIITNPEFNNLYIIDRQNKRIIVLTKKGDLIKQYALQISSVLKSFQVSADEKNIFVLTGSKIYQIAN